MIFFILVEFSFLGLESGKLSREKREMKKSHGSLERQTSLIQCRIWVESRNHMLAMVVSPQNQYRIVSGDPIAGTRSPLFHLPDTLSNTNTAINLICFRVNTNNLMYENRRCQ